MSERVSLTVDDCGLDDLADGVNTDAMPLLQPDDEAESSFRSEIEPSEEQKRSLRRVADSLPWSAFIVAIVELCERFAYYGLSGPFQNYISNKYHDPSGNPGAIGLDQQAATGLTNFFQFWCYVTPILGAVVADQYLGKYRTIVLFSVCYLTGLVVLFLSSLPVSIENGGALPGLIIAMIIIGLGTGGIKSNVSPMIAEQYQQSALRLKVIKSGEQVIVDPSMTVQRIYMIFYLCINIGSLSGIATTTLELRIGFWSAYLLPLFMFCIGFSVLISNKRKYILRPPRGSVIPHAIRCIWIGLRDKHGFEAAKPSFQRKAIGRRQSIDWDDEFVDELRRALIACKVFLFYPFYWVVYMQMINNFVSQAGTMQLHGIPNDIMGNIDPISILVLIPVCDRLLYPALQTAGIRFRPIARISWGFMLASFSMAYAAGVQYAIYRAPPCYEYPLRCPEAKQADGTLEHNRINVAVQAPAYLLVALSEIFASVTGLEYAYTKAPASMKSFMSSLFLLTSALGAALGAAIAPAAKDPNLTRFYGWLAVASLTAGALFWVLFRRYDAQEDRLNGMNWKLEVPEDLAGVSVAVELSKLDERVRVEGVAYG